MRHMKGWLARVCKDRQSASPSLLDTRLGMTLTLTRRRAAIAFRCIAIL